MYRLYKSTDGVNAIIRTSDGAIIPIDVRNIDYREYQAWLSAGNTPSPAA